MMPKYAESGTGGIPRRAFNDPRALSSLGSSNLSSGFSSFQPTTRASAANLNKAPFNDPQKSGVIYVSPDTASLVATRSKSLSADQKRQISKERATAVRNKPLGGSFTPAVAVPLKAFREARADPRSTTASGGNEVNSYRVPRTTSFNTNSPVQVRARSNRLNRELRKVPSSQIGD